jgi:hypothetical protein
MSNDEHDMAILRLVKGRGEAKRRKALLESELRTAGKALSEIGSGLRSVSSSGAVHETPGYLLQKVAQSPEICGFARLGTVLGELKEVDEDLRQLNQTARELGID